MDPSLHRLRVAYRKRDRLAHLGHLEVLHTIERSVRRSGLPFGVSSGFARRMRLQFAQALPVGAASECEYFDVGLTRRVEAADALDALARSTPSQLGPYACAYVPAFLPALEAWLTRASWSVAIRWRGGTAVALERAIKALFDEGTLAFMRGTRPRTISLAQTLVGWHAVEGGEGVVALALETRSSERGALRPAVLLAAALERPELAGVSCASMAVTRTAQLHEASDGLLEDPFDVTISSVCER